MGLNVHDEMRGATEEAAAMERRLFRLMCWTVTLAVLLSLPFAPWRVTTGLLLGGALALLNHRWLSSSVRAVFSDAAVRGARPQLGSARFILRYFVVAACIFAAYELKLVAIVATLAGLCAFVVAALIEGFIQTYLTFTQTRGH